MSPCGQDPDGKVRVYGLLRTLEFKGLRDLGFRVVVFMLSLEQLGALQGRDQTTRLANAYADFAAYCKANQVRSWCPIYSMGRSR